LFANIYIYIYIYVASSSSSSSPRKEAEGATKEKVRGAMMYAMEFPDEAVIDPYDPQVSYLCICG
jgi:hypothetical protein